MVNLSSEQVIECSTDQEESAGNRRRGLSDANDVAEMLFDRRFNAATSIPPGAVLLST
jgi:hypothetical protein